MSYGVIYLVTCLINGKQYVGQTVHYNPLERWRRHLYDAASRTGDTVFCRALRKYGEDSFTFEVIDYAADALSLGAKEASYIEELNTLLPNGYNMREGGVRGRLTEEAKQLIRDACSRPEVQIKLRNRFCLKGEDHPRAKLSREEAREIRTSIEPTAVLSARYGIGTSSISSIRLGKIYKEDGAIYQKQYEAVLERSHIIATCKTCEKNFKINEWRVIGDSTRGQYCSQECYHKSHAVDRIQTRCEICGKAVLRTRRLAQKRRFCSCQCASVARRGKPMGHGEAVSLGLFRAYAEGRGPAQTRNKSS